MEENKKHKPFIEDGMEYNTDRRDIKMTQYGRNIQKLVDFALTIEDKEKRNRAAIQVVQAMEILNPRIRYIDEYKKVLWNHLAMMSGHKLDIDYPYEIIAEEDIYSKPEQIPLEKVRMKKRQYGRIIQGLVNKALEVEDPELQKEFILIILVQMKRIYINWNKDVVSDEVIFEDFKKLADYKLEIPANFRLPQSYEIKNKLSKSSTTNPPSNNNTNYRKYRKR
ncbi:MAG: DUF4290 domain-containing protein [Bacteroidales bacterium]|nr:DUF4290 domain-containing protein [Bacteroidales bacterium]